MSNLWQHVRKRIDVRHVSNEKEYLNRASEPSYTSQKKKKSKSKVTLKLTKLAYAGMRIIDLSKVLVCEFHYDYIKNKYGHNSRLLFPDTDTLIYEIKTDDFSKDKRIFNFSNYSAKSKY